jgi:hypothetical protein
MNITIPHTGIFNDTLILGFRKVFLANGGGVLPALGSILVLVVRIALLVILQSLNNLLHEVKTQQHL